MRKENPFDLIFIVGYIANAVLMTSVAMLFRYADFVRQCGGSELHLGWIVGTGMAGALLVRYVQGVALDRWGIRLVWNCSLALYVASVLWHLKIDRVDTVEVYAARVALMMGVAGAFGASTTFVSLRAPPHRTAELIGVLGSSGFVGMAIGPWIGDVMAAYVRDALLQVRGMFLGSALLGAVGWALVAWATADVPAPTARRLPPAWRVIRRYHPGTLLVVAVAMGLGLQMPNIFLRPYAAELGLEEIHSFFVVYAVSAFLVRLLTRQWTDRAGAKPVALVGLLCLSVSMVLYLSVRAAWQWVAPATFAGVAHALLFPAVVSGGSLSFPMRYRGIAVTLMLAMFDLGALLGQPLVGSLLEVCRALQWPAYPVTFLVVATLLAIVGVIYGCSPSSRNAQGRSALATVKDPASHQTSENCEHHHLSCTRPQ